MQDNKQIVLMLSVNGPCIVAVITTAERFYDIDISINSICPLFIAWSLSHEQRLHGLMFAFDKALIFNSEEKVTYPKTDVISFKPDVANATGSSCDTRRTGKLGLIITSTL